jgi:hypothetical protein
VPRGGSDAVNPAWRRALAHVGKCHFISIPLTCGPSEKEVRLTRG